MLVGRKEGRGKSQAIYTGAHRGWAYAGVERLFGRQLTCFSCVSKEPLHLHFDRRYDTNPGEPKAYH